MKLERRSKIRNMNKIIYAIFLLLGQVSFAQNTNPFKSIGKEAEVLTLSKGKYIEVHNNDSLQRIGSVIVNVNTGTIYELLDVDTLYSESTLDPTIISRWYSPDPLESKYPNMSPYVFAANSPIAFYDTDGRDWFYYMAEGETEAKYHWHKGSEHTIVTSVDVSGNVQTQTLQGHKAVVVVQGSRNETLGPNDKINEVGAITATITVYGPGGADDVSTYTGYTMTSNAPAYTPIDEGVYVQRRRRDKGTGVIPKYYRILNADGTDGIRTLDGATNNNAPKQLSDNGEGYKTEIFLHRTNNNGWAGGKVSTGCILIDPNDINKYEAQLAPIGNGVKIPFILYRSGSDHNPDIEAPIENSKAPTISPNLPDPSIFPIEPSDHQYVNPNLYKEYPERPTFTTPKSGENKGKKTP